MPVLACAIQKGGSGKTTTTVNLATELAQAGKRVLVLDLDPQFNLTMALGIDPTTVQFSSYEVLLNPAQGVRFATQTTAHGIDLVPANFDLAGAELTLAGRFGRESFLRTALAEARKQYHYILLDTPPSLGLLTVNALCAADSILVPMQAHVFALRAMPQLENTLTMVRALNPTLNIGGIVVTMVDQRTTVSKTIESQIREQYGAVVFRTTIPLNVRLVESPAFGQPINQYAADSAGARAYRQLAQEVIERYG